MRSCQYKGPHHLYVVDEADMSSSSNQVVQVSKSRESYCSGLQKFMLTRIISPLHLFSMLSIISQ